MSTFIQTLKKTYFSITDGGGDIGETGGIEPDNIMEIGNTEKGAPDL
jgi:hypothetical protein